MVTAKSDAMEFQHTGLRWSRREMLPPSALKSMNVLFATTSRRAADRNCVCPAAKLGCAKGLNNRAAREQGSLAAMGGVDDD